MYGSHVISTFLEHNILSVENNQFTQILETLYWIVRLLKKTVDSFLWARHFVSTSDSSIRGTSSYQGSSVTSKSKRRCKEFQSSQLM